MSLLAFETRQSPVGDLLDHSQRQKIASELNAAILSSQCQEKDPKLPSMLKMLIWAQVDLAYQNQLEEKVTFPKISKLDTAEFDQM
jgi:hypothetical protein